jgi:branched-chain amino acid transport system substrate-binding protein
MRHFVALAGTLFLTATIASSFPARAAFKCEGGAITIGSARAKTGGFAFFDEAGRKGLSVAIDQINRSGGVDGCMIKLIEGDTQSNPALANQVAEELIQKGAKIILAPADFDIGVGASLAAQSHGLFAFSPEAAAVAWPQAVGPNFVIGATIISDIGRGVASYAKKRGWKSVYIATNPAFNYFTQQEEAFNKAFAGGVIGRDKLADNATDYAAVVTKIRNAQPTPDFIYLNDYFPHVGTFIKQLRASGVTAPVLGNGSYSSPTLPEVVGATALRNVYYLNNAYYEGRDVDPGVAKFVSDYRAKFGSGPENTNSLLGYYNGLILAKALATAGSTDAAAITAGITSQTDMALPGATYYRWENRAPRTSQVVIGFSTEGAFQLVDTVNVSNAH